ncbi:malto-oligosyltrehalose trehalohydrolase [Bordetella hinzii]|uniref:malto-oligosyltrehalose trehalohydrolase n=1 Tax=Bordetella hinzii TaxID=103855 RepID=UPI0013EFCDF5|nr:malto-oligosyltrehalose trehalohydrolase [Bordetella hinzii]QII85403.1 malto-oligosyltrehalose trehalohydrolase [Bordetella hinzii]
MSSLLLDGSAPCGAFPQADGSAVFRIWAPDAPAGMMLCVEGHAPRPVAPDAQGYCAHRLDACPPGSRYHYRLADGTRMPDPASRLQDGDVHDDSVVVDDSAYPWRHTHWQPHAWESSVIYEAHVGLAGGYAGLRERLPALAALGINVLQLMPIADFPGPRNWGYDGVLPYAPDRAYGEPRALRQLIDSAHGLGMAVMLDVVYNHFGPDGNYLPRYAARFFRQDRATPWGAAIDFRQPAVQRFFEDSAVHWLQDYRFDGLRLDAVHAIPAPDWLRALPARLRQRLPGRRLYLVIEDEANRACLLDAGYDAQWNDDWHHVMHHLLTGEAQGYYSGYCSGPAGILARCLTEGWHYQGQPSPFHGGRPRGEPSAHLPASAFVCFLQNHDQTGNRAHGERLTRLAATPQRLQAAIALQLLTPAVPLIFMGEEYGAQTPFLYFTSHADAALADAVRQGRAREFAAMPGYRDEGRGLPDPNAPETFERCLPRPRNGEHRVWTAYYTRLLDLRARCLAPRLGGTCAEDATPLGEAAVHAAWRLGDGARLQAYTNLGASACRLPRRLRPAGQASLRFESTPGCLALMSQGLLPPDATVCLIQEPS